MKHESHPHNHHQNHSHQQKSGLDNNQKYTCPMHPQVIKDEQGKCPICGMNLVPLGASKVINGQNHDKHAGHHTDDFLKRFWICLVITIPILLLSHMIQQWFGFEINFTGANYVLLALSTFVSFYMNF